MFKPVDLSGEDAYRQLLRGLSYAYDYTRGRLPKNEMIRWDKNGLTVFDIFDIESAKKNKTFKVDYWGNLLGTFKKNDITIDVKIAPDPYVTIFDVGKHPGTDNMIATWMKGDKGLGEKVIVRMRFNMCDNCDFFLYSLKLIQSGLWQR